MKNLTEYDSDIFDARIQHPFTMIVYGPSMSGKTLFTLELIRSEQELISGHFTKIIWFYGIETKQINNLSDIDKRITPVKGLPESLEEYREQNTLLVFDDLMQESANSKLITELITRKCHHQNTSVILIMQDLFYGGTQRKTFLRNTHYLTLFSNPLDRSGITAVASKIMPKQTQSFLQMYERATSGAHGYLFIDGRQTTPARARFRTDIFPPFQKVYVLSP